VLDSSAAVKGTIAAGHRFNAIGPTARGALLMALSLVLVVSANALARILISRYPATEVLFFRFVCALPVVLACSGGLELHELATRRIGTHVLRACLTVGATLSLYAASQHLLFADLIAISYSTPLFVGFFAMPLLGEHVDLRRGVLIVIGFLGVITLAFPGRLEIWSLGALAMAMLNALAVLTSRSLAVTEKTASMAIHFTVLGILISGSLLPFHWVAPDPEDLLWLATLGLAAGLAIHLHAHAFRLAAASFLAPIDYFGVVVSALIGIALFSEVPSLYTLLGGSLVVAAGTFHIWFGIRNKR